MLKKSLILLCLILLPLLPLLSSAHPTVSVGMNAIYKASQADKVLNDFEFPFVVAIYYKDDPSTGAEEAGCTGTVIGKNWVLTAAHCVFYPPKQAADSLLVGTGFLAKKRTTAKTVLHVKKIYTLNENDLITHDIALLQLVETTDIQPVALPGSAKDFPNLKTSHLPALVLGYGWINTGPEDYLDFKFDNYLHKGDEVIQDDQTIELLIQKYKLLSPEPPRRTRPYSLL